MRSLAVRIVVGLLAGAAGFYLGFFALLAVTGLDLPGWLPVAALTGVGLCSTAVVAALSGLEVARTAALAAAGGAGGAVAGALVMQIGDSFEWAILAGLGLVGAAVVVSSRLAAPA